MNPSFSTFGDLLKFLRRRARLTQKDLSIAVGYSESHLSRLEGNERPPDTATLAALFVPALRLEKEPELVARMIELATAARGEIRSGAHTPPRTGRDAAPQTLEPPGHPLQSAPNNLPIPLTSFVGRAREIFEGVQLSTHYRLVTLTGSGGCGKTRLALRIAEEALSAYPHGVWLVELAPLGVSALIPQTIASVLGVQERRDRSLSTVLSEFLRPRHLLLILDNCEHLIAEVAVLVEALMRTCPHLHILATSRETLNVSGEITFRVPPLRLPSLGWVRSLERVAEAEAVKLFVERARAGLPAFALTEQNVAAVAQICTRLDGIPLALELAAARVRLLQVEQIAARLDDRFALLSTGPRDLPARHRALQAVMNWSYSLLEQEEQNLLNQLSVFAGSFSLEVVEAICGATRAGNLDLLARLVDKSLVVAENHPGGMRYHLLETVRQYAQIQLTETGEETATRECHARFYLTWVEKAEAKLLSKERATVIQEIDRDYDDLRCALDWACRAASWELALRLVGALTWFWHFRGYFSEARTQAEKTILAYKEDTEHPMAGNSRLAVLGKALWSAGLFAWIQGDLAHAHKQYAASIVLLRQTENKRVLAHALSNLGLVVLDEGALAQAHTLTEEAVALARQWGAPWDLALLLYNFGEVIYTQGDEAAARPILEESQTLFRQLGDQWGISIPTFLFGLIAGHRQDYAAARLHFEEALAMQREEEDAWGTAEALLLLGQAEHQLGDLRQAASHYEESLRLNAERVGDKAILVRGLYSLGHLSMAQGEMARAVRLLGASRALQEGSGSSTRRSILYQDDRQTITTLQEVLGESAFKIAWAEGQAMTMGQAIQLALGDE